MDRPRFWKWLHRIGYVCTALVAIELIALAFGLAAMWLGRLHEKAALRADLSTRNGLLVGSDIVRADAIREFAPLPSPSKLVPDGFRFTAMPQLSRYWYALSLKDGADRASGMLIVTERRQDGTNATFSTLQFTLPHSEYTQLMAAIDQLVEGFDGGNPPGHCMDGTEIAFERFRGRHVYSGIGNAGCYSHYRKLGEEIRSMLSRHFMLPGPPLMRDWYPVPDRRPK